MAEVILEKLTKRFRDVVAVDAIDLRIDAGELLVLVGPSGCGKTTTLRMIAGLEDITSGRILIGQREVNGVAAKDRDIAMVFQNYALYPHMNVYKNMAFGLKMRRVPRQEIDVRVRRAARTLGIEELLNRKPAQLSGGQRQRVAVGRAIVRDPHVFLLDEPLSNLDAKLRVSMRTELVKLQQQLGTTMIHVTHDQVEAMMMGQRIVVMNQGHIQQVGRPLEVYDTPVNRFVAEFIGSPPMNFVAGRIEFQSDQPWFLSPDLSIPLPTANIDRYRPWTGRKVTLGVRPEHLAPAAAGTDGQKPALPRGEVLVAQSLGAEMLLDVRIGSVELVARVDPHESLASGDQIDLAIDTARCHIFGEDSGQVI